MGSRFATSSDSPVHQNIKDTVVAKTQHDTVYSPNFDGIPARYIKTPTSIKLTRKPMNFIVTAIKAIPAAKIVNQPIWKIMLGMLVRLDKVKMLAYFGAAMPRLKTATEDGDLDYGMQFIGQTQGLINDTPNVQEIIDRVIKEAMAAQIRNGEALK
jgi:enoyl-[acyl-carrier protein] reductase II